MLKCELLKPEVLMYIFSLAFQVAGAVLLIIKYFGTTREQIIDEYYPGSNIANPDKNGMVTLEVDIVKKCVRRIYDNRMAFVFIAVGYVLSIFGETGTCCKICLFAFVFGVTVIIIDAEKIIARKLVDLWYKENILVPHRKVKEKTDQTVVEF